MGKLVIALLLATVSVAVAQTTSGGTISIAVGSKLKFTYEPKPDITTLELSKVMELLLFAQNCKVYVGGYFNECNILKKIEELPPEIKRHFVRYEN